MPKRDQGQILFIKYINKKLEIVASTAFLSPPPSLRSLSPPHCLSPLLVPIIYVKWSSVGPAHQISEASFGDASKLIDEQQGKWTCKAFGSGLSIKPTGIGNNRILGFVFFFFISLVLNKLTRIRRESKRFPWRGSIWKLNQRTNKY